MKCIQEELEQIQTYAREAIGDHNIFGNNEYGGINWGAVNVADVCFCQSIHGDCYYEVLIDEVSPDAWEFTHAIHAFIKKHSDVTYPIEVRTEW